MHALAIDTQKKGHLVTGSDDEIYEPSRSQLAKHGLLPKHMGWDASLITPDIELVVLGMHAKEDNPELQKAMDLDIRIVSFPAFIAELSSEKKRIVIAGSHGKTTTTSMIMHVLKHLGMPFDYLVGARLDGFENMVSISDAPMIIIEGDEYLSSAIDRRPKIVHYQPDITVVTGIEWDHMNVFPTDDIYTDQFKNYIDALNDDTTLFYNAHDEKLNDIVRHHGKYKAFIPYDAHPYMQEDDQVILFSDSDKIPVRIFGRHNMENLQAALLVCNKLGVSASDFYEAIQTFSGAHKRLQILCAIGSHIAYWDFAHAPSKVKATVNAVREKHPDSHFIACLELHTYSSLNEAFIANYHETLSSADQKLVFYDEHTFEIKKLPFLNSSEVNSAFGGDVEVFTQMSALKKALREAIQPHTALLFMSSGTFSQTDLTVLSKSLFNEQVELPE